MIAHELWDIDYGEVTRTSTTKKKFTITIGEVDYDGIIVEEVSDHDISTSVDWDDDVPPNYEDVELYIINNQ